jgi:RNA polymerase sigma factor (sigma-70 family)
MTAISTLRGNAMSAEPATLVRHLRRLVTARATGQRSDAELVADFAARGEPAAFEALVRRHGPMVLAAGRRVLHHREDAEDVFQATFLLLARKAGSLRHAEAVGSWLYGVARRLALHARARAARERLYERATNPAPPAEPLTDLTLREARAIFDEELGRLAERHRAPLVLCCLEGLTRDEAARRLGWRLATVKNRLERARELLRRRLRRRGLTVPAALGAVLLAQDTTTAALPAELLHRAVHGALAGASAPSAPVAALVAEGLRAAGAVRPKVALALCLAGLLTAGVLGYRGSAGQPAATPPANPPAAGDRTVSNGNKRPAADGFGDPLPAGALVRFGTVRFRHGNFLTGFALSPDNKRLVTVGGNPVTRVWDFTTGRELVHRDGEASGGTQAVAFSPDGRTIATRDCVGNLHLWDPATGKDVCRSGTGQSPTFVLAFSPDGTRVAAAGMATVPLEVWRVHGGSLTLDWQITDNDIGPVRVLVGVRTLAWSPDGRTLACGHMEDGDIRLLDAATGKVLRRLVGHKGRVNTVAFSPDGTLLASGGGEDHKVRLWNVAAGRPRRVLATVPGEVLAVGFTPDGTRLACSGGDREPVLGLWDVTTGRQVRRLGDGHDKVVALAFTHDGRTLAAAMGGAVRLWDVQTNRERGPAGGHASFVCAARSSPDGRTVVTAGGDRTVRVWDAATGRERRRLEGHTDEIRDVAFMPDGRRLASAAADGTVRLWDLASGKEVRRMDAGLTGGQRRLVYALAVSPDGRKLASGDYFGDCAHVWETATGKELHRIPHPGGVMCLAFSPDGRTLATGDHLSRTEFAGAPASSTTVYLRLWDVNSGRQVRSIAAHDYWIHALAYSPDGRLLATVAGDKYLRVWDTATGHKAWQTEGDKRGNTAVAFSPDGKTLAWGEFGGAVRLWEVATQRERRRFVGHPAAVHSLAFSPDGRMLVSSSMDTTAVAWDVTGLRTRGAPLMDAAAAWEALPATDAARADEAVWSLAASPGRALRLLRERLRPASAATVGQMRRFIADLDSRRFAAREAATRELARLGLLAEPALRQALAGASPEARRRLERLLVGAQGPVPAGELLRELRAVEVLEHIGDAEARELLARLATGAPESLLTRDAKQALARLKPRSPKKGHSEFGPVDKQPTEGKRPSEYR